MEAVAQNLQILLPLILLPLALGFAVAAEILRRRSPRPRARDLLRRSRREEPNDLIRRLGRSSPRAGDTRGLRTRIVSIGIPSSPTPAPITPEPMPFADTTQPYLGDARLLIDRILFDEIGDPNPPGPDPDAGQ